MCLGHRKKEISWFVGPYATRDQLKKFIRMNEEKTMSKDDKDMPEQNEPMQDENEAALEMLLGQMSQDSRTSTSR